MVRFSQVGLRYPDPAPGGDGTRETLRDLSFTLPQGSFTWLTGPSGAGKTSLLRLMQLALRPTRGEVEVLGVPVSRAPRADLPRLRRRIGAVFQEFRLLPYLTAFDNVALPLRLAGRPEAGLRPDVAEMLRWVGLAGREESLPRQLSGGEQQRVAIARAVVTRPALLVADEPTGNLDPAQARRLLLLLAEMNRLGATVVVATHSRELVAQHPGHVMAMEDGRIVSLDPWPHAEGAADGAQVDWASVDWAPADRGPMDRGPVDRGPVDRGPVDRGPADRGPADRALADRGMTEAATGAGDAGPGATAAGDAEGTPLPAGFAPPPAEAPAPEEDPTPARRFGSIWPSARPPSGAPRV